MEIKCSVDGSDKNRLHQLTWHREQSRLQLNESRFKTTEDQDLVTYTENESPAWTAFPSDDIPEDTKQSDQRVHEAGEYVVITSDEMIKDQKT